jgi:hypothetical protein
MFWDNKYKDYKYFKNYEVEVDYNCKYKENIDGIVEVLINKILGIFLTNTPIQNKRILGIDEETRKEYLEKNKLNKFYMDIINLQKRVDTLKLKVEIKET